MLDPSLDPGNLWFDEDLAYSECKNNSWSSALCSKFTFYGGIFAIALKIIEKIEP